MVHPLKRGKALRGTLPLTDRVCAVSQARPQSSTSGESTDHCPPETGAMVTESTLSSPLSTTWGAAKSGRGKERNTPPTSCCWRLPCGTRETPLWRRRAVGKECGGNASRKREAREERRMGQRSLSVGKPRTPGGGLPAQAPRLCAEGNKGPQCTRKLSAGGRLWHWRNGHRRFMARHGEGSQVLSRVRSKPQARC
jgi:hypothetical protein